MIPSEEMSHDPRARLLCFDALFVSDKICSMKLNVIFIPHRTRCITHGQGPLFTYSIGSTFDDLEKLGRMS
jgi:hypothetical protein